MDYLELSIEKLNNDCQKWALEIQKDYKADLIIYIAKGGYLIGKSFENVFNVPLIGIKTERRGNKVKDFFMPLIVKLPTLICNILREIELKTNIHNKCKNRKVVIDYDSINKINKKEIDKILIVDDSVDTGYSMKFVCDEIKKIFVNSKVKLAAINIWSDSEKVINIDYFMYKDVIIRTPMSKDSKEYDTFLKLYNERKER